MPTRSTSLWDAQVGANRPATRQNLNGPVGSSGDGGHVTGRVKSLSEITAEVADEWRKDGRMTVPPDTPAVGEDEVAFWDEVERRFNAQRPDRDGPREADTASDWRLD